MSLSNKAIATSKLLTTYPKKQQSDILDFLFKPNFGASLQILKVEIGGDAQSSEGTESSHMHEEWDENYNRGYEWWMMKEAKRRNPSIKLIGLPWGFPGWLGGGDWFPFHNPNKTAKYITNWILGAKKFHNLDIDYVGIWNEKWYDPMYVKVLRAMLNDLGLKKVQIIAADLLPVDCWDITNDLSRDAQLNSSIGILGCHYGGTESSEMAKDSGKPLWSSEDWSVFNDENGGGCMARLLNRNYVNGLITSTIAWNILYAYYPKLMYGGVGLMTAIEPWSGYFSVQSPIWMAAHTTQFTSPGWRYLAHGSGVGWLKGGGSIVSLTNSSDLTIILETMDAAAHNFCPRNDAEKIPVKTQNISLIINSDILTMHLWFSQLGMNITRSVYFKYLGPMTVVNNTIHLHLEVNSVYTLTTLTQGHRGEVNDIPRSGSFPLPYSDNFEGYTIDQEAANFAQQVGVFEVHQSCSAKRGKILRQVLLNAPVHWCPEVLTQPFAVIGDYAWNDLRADVSVMIPHVNSSRAAFLALKVDQGSCTAFLAQGVFLWVTPSSRSFELSFDLARTKKLASGPVAVGYDEWCSLSLQIKNETLTASVNGKILFRSVLASLPTEGFVAIGADGFGQVEFDDFALLKP
ncbi:hypothetical protein CAPTEDRAFT_206938 [Capitella teleta]|uniref:galactosylceramidase n=1 Tax=Capitella teleta TaxID=283909 RepID=R7UU76_CAPTE|nr:hypothetical protein CAPTEDRAFT_206938 [Capitella teleta]|eukprot:ELU09745.1 hypothetical protein CAPTEDRAFT_206938 [Capitella teleta]